MEPAFMGAIIGAAVAIFAGVFLTMRGKKS